MTKQRFPILATVVLAVALLFSAVGVSQAQPANAQDGGFREVPVLASAARTATGTSAAICGLAQFDKFAMQLVVSAASGTSPTLDPTWQHSIDGGTTWHTVVAFTQKTTTGNELKVESEVLAGTAEVYGDCMRVSYAIGGTTPSFTFKMDLFAA
jgi:hypothetical protein